MICSSRGEGENGGLLSGSVFLAAPADRTHGSPRPEEFASPLGKRVYDLRHTCLTTWLNNGVPPAQVAEWAGNSVPVLLATYARSISGQLRDHQKRIESSGDLPDLTAEG
ncbi:hypothetical protein ABZS61_02865 [Streptomyces sp. NPDC005566]|uniref:hypothetical protein n=1 Tax=Streptomyces sp. NPDC005566 TaxID=3156886 RepID=UPI0033B40E73